MSKSNLETVFQALNRANTEGVFNMQESMAVGTAFNVISKEVEKVSKLEAEVKKLNEINNQREVMEKCPTHEVEEASVEKPTKKVSNKK